MLNEISIKHIIKHHLKIMMLHKIYMFHYQLNQNTCCNLKFAINITTEPNRLMNRHRSSRSGPFCLSWVCPWFTPGVNLRWCGLNFQWVTPGLNQG